MRTVPLWQCLCSVAPTQLHGAGWGWLEADPSMGTAVATGAIPAAPLGLACWGACFSPRGAACSHPWAHGCSPRNEPPAVSPAAPGVSGRMAAGQGWGGTATVPTSSSCVTFSGQLLAAAPCPFPLCLVSWNRASFITVSFKRSNFFCGVTWLLCQQHLVLAWLCCGNCN